MKRLLSVLMALTLITGLMINLTSCSMPRTYRLPGKNEQEIIDNQLEILIDAIEDEDVDAIIDMFSEEALDEIDDEDKMDEFEDSIEELIETFPDWDGDYDGYDDLTVREYNHHSRKNESYYCYKPDISFTVDGEDYELHMVMIYRADEEERVGLRVIQLCHDDCSNYISAGFYSKPGLEVFPGVYCWDCEIVKRDEKY